MYLTTTAIIIFISSKSTLIKIYYLIFNAHSFILDKNEWIGKSMKIILKEIGLNEINDVESIIQKKMNHFTLRSWSDILY